MPKPHGKGGPGYQKPKNMGKTIGKLMRYVGRSKWLLAVVAVCLLMNTVCSIRGTYMLQIGRASCRERVYVLV